MSKMSEIKPKLVGGSPWWVCGKEDCPEYHRSGFEQYDPSFCTITGKPPRGDCLPWYQREIERLREYEKQCNRLAQMFGKGLIAEGVPAAIEYIEATKQESEADR
jgi:hypothetical protein